jgi:hypothetical protein
MSELEILGTPINTAGARIDTIRVAEPVQPPSLVNRFKRAIRFAAKRDRPLDYGNAQTRADSANHHSLLQAVEQTLTRSGLVPHKVYPAVADHKGQYRASVVAEVLGERNRGAGEYGAAWQGLIAHQPGMVAFRSHPQGADSVYRFAFKGPVTAMAQLLDHAGVANRIFVPHGEGTHVYLYDRGRQLRQGVGNLVTRLGLQAVEHTGNGQASQRLPRPDQVARS